MGLYASVAELEDAHFKRSLSRLPTTFIPPKVWDGTGWTVEEYRLTFLSLPVQTDVKVHCVDCDRTFMIPSYLAGPIEYSYCPCCYERHQP